jgi:hypothetical protein
MAAYPRIAAPVRFVDVFPRTPGRKILLVPKDLDWRPGRVRRRLDGDGYLPARSDLAAADPAISSTLGGLP